MEVLKEQHGDGPSVCDHFAQLIDKVIFQTPDDPFATLEVLSRLVKKPEQPAVQFGEEELEIMKNAATARLKVTEAELDESGLPKPVCAIPNFLEEAEMFEWAGYGFGELESYQIMCSIRKLAGELEEQNLRQLRFWGKILGTEADYYVAEGQPTEGGGGEGDELPDDMEPPGTGANEYCFWVTTDLTCETHPWVKLPHIRSSQIVAARKIKKMLTGNLDDPVITHPHFLGSDGAVWGERVLLRAQLARITADTVICLKGFITVDEDNNIAETEPADWAANCPTVEQLAKKDAWIHMRDHILRSGKTTHPEVPEDPPDEDAPEEDKKAYAKLVREVSLDPLKPKLRTIDAFPTLQWAVKQVGDPTMYDKEAPKSSAISAVRSLTWPGAVCVAKGGSFSNLYIGEGLKSGEPDFYPLSPPDVQEEPPDPGEVPEPQTCPTLLNKPAGEGDEGEGN